MITQRQLDAIHAQIAKLDTNAQGAVLDLLGRIDFNDKQALKDALTEVLRPICETSAQLSAELASAVYNGFRAAEIGETIETVAESTFQAGKYAAMANTAVGKPTFDEMVNVVNGFIGYTNRASYSNAMFASRRRDPIKPRYARVPQGSETCPFCMMLASRGFEYYRGEEGAKVHNHANCDCIYVPSWSKSQLVENYDPDEFYSKWKDAVGEEAEQAAERKGTSVEEERNRIMAYYENSAKKRSTSEPTQERRFLGDTDPTRKTIGKVADDMLDNTRYVGESREDWLKRMQAAANEQVRRGNNN